jgi:hypothetical protein
MTDETREIHFYVKAHKLRIASFNFGPGLCHQPSYENLERRNQLFSCMWHHLLPLYSLCHVSYIARSERSLSFRGSFCRKKSDLAFFTHLLRLRSLHASTICFFILNFRVRLLELCSEAPLKRNCAPSKTRVCVINFILSRNYFIISFSMRSDMTVCERSHNKTFAFHRISLSVGRALEFYFLFT